MTFTAYVAKDRRFSDMSFDFLITSQTAKEWYGDVQQEMPERLWCAQRIKPGFVVIDCGAHHGMTTLLFSKLVGPSGSVIAFEPVQSNVDVIRDNARLNGLTNIDARACGVGDKRSTSYVTLSENAVLSAVDALPFYRKFNNPWSNKTRLDIHPLDEQIPASVSPNLIKIDVEGGELPALIGAARTLKSRPFLAIEIHNFIHKGHDLADIRDLLHALGYRYYFNGDILAEVEGPFQELDIQRIATFPNPHIYCEPLS